MMDMKRGQLVRLPGVAKLLIVAVLFVCGCAKSEVSLTGTWANVRAPETVEFKNDNTGLFVVKDRPSLPFKWVVAADGRVKMDIAFMGTTRTLYGKIDNGALVVENAGQKESYRKVR